MGDNHNNYGHRPAYVRTRPHRVHILCTVGMHMHPTHNGVYTHCMSMVDVRYQTGMHMKSARVLLQVLVLVP